MSETDTEVDESRSESSTDSGNNVSREVVEVGTTIDDYDEPTGISLITTEIENTTDGTDGVHFETDETLTVEVGQSVGNECWAEVDYFIALETEYELDEMQQQMMAMQQGVEADEIDAHVEEASVFISNEDGEIGAGLIRDEGGTVNGVIQQFADSIDGTELNIEFAEEELEDAEVAASEAGN